MLPLDKTQTPLAIFNQIIDSNFGTVTAFAKATGDSGIGVDVSDYRSGKPISPRLLRAVMAHFPRELRMIFMEQWLESKIPGVYDKNYCIIIRKQTQEVIMEWWKFPIDEREEIMHMATHYIEQKIDINQAMRVSIDLHRTNLQIRQRNTACVI